MSRTNEFVLNAATLLVTVAALVMVGIRVDQAFFAPGRNAPKPRRVENWRELAMAGNRIGPAVARVTIVEFTDFQCPFCRRMAADLKDIRRQFPDAVSVVVRHFPLPGHKFAVAAAQASECAARQNAFEAFHDRLFQSQDAIGREPWSAFARQADIKDMPAFEACLADRRVADAVERDRAAGERHGVVATPTVLINDLEINWYPGEGKLAELVRSALDATPAIH